ncbi:MAG: ATP-binding cassette domain-containing protein [Clostridium perfringens]|uniref:ABC transporter, ATP-binding protein n=1 Tax=Clostridium perfringens (strain ATCC 13124 / DSM 756 / JCM 1290 / NCIMB 6125 / NCTC 8237 / Type A) TaxID=195103 RepID=A0A0H2YRT6_CLOP1|nr:ATP-binding cassette domain-containing protein [Clostridium perfringens]ABG83732.1 ABC transporter, ATP-binding protein [Clostridium perfringens ATCC 13124]EHK2278134.1 ATP-binding cassette domain-containing protein [Clostridium perfringens]ELC8369933.1 ATP-binding cassette domain-containing protein [Clostridium perfringens]ELC8404334.1 ATP-binding cassette domain-containing protein [Clostridium perfringens]MBO3375314.1 ATP-binding cassette domain-containing protein [Clostridium perfringens
MLVVNNVSKKYGSFYALKDINLEFNNGVYALLAPNGAGKTTLIKLLTTLIFPTSGEILYKGTDIVSLDGEYRDIIGYLPQDFGYYRNYTPRKFLLYLAALKGIKKEDAVEKVKEVLKVVSLENVENKKMKGFSGGMIQRVGIAQALLNDPKILILDEPTAGLDPKERVRFRNLLSDLSRDRIVIISTHIVSDIEFISNEVIMIKDHKILYKDSIENICSTLDGMVYETSMTFEESKEFRKKYILLSEKQDSGIMKARFISQGNNDEKWVRVNPNIEDVFLYQYRDEELEG